MVLILQGMVTECPKPDPVRLTRFALPRRQSSVAAQLRNRIIRGELKEGESLPPEPQLLEELSVSRPTLREAFRILESEALISVRRGLHGGARVHAPNQNVAGRYMGLLLQYRDTSLADVYDARKVIESSSVTKLLAAPPKGAIAELERMLISADERHGEIPEYLKAQEEFHLALARLAGNESLNVVTEMLYYIIDYGKDYILAHGESDPKQTLARAEESSRIHHRFVELIKAGDADEAADLWDRHITDATDMLLSGVNPASVLDLLG